MKKFQPVKKASDEGEVVPKNLCEDFYEPMMPSLVRKQEECRLFQEEVEPNYEAMEPCISGKHDEYATVFEGAISNYETVEPLPSSVPYSSAKSHQSLNSKSAQSLREEPFYCSLTSIFHGNSPVERPSHVYVKLEQKSFTKSPRKTKS